MNFSPASSPESTPEERRREIQLFLGQYHGLLASAIDLLELELGHRATEPVGELRTLLASAVDAFPGASASAGRVQAALNSGVVDKRLGRLGLEGEQLEPKKRGFWFNLHRFHGVPKKVKVLQDFLKRSRYAVRGIKWGNVIIGSLSAEIGKIPGIEPLKEFGDVVLNILEETREAATTR